MTSRNFTIVETTESDRTYIARLNYITDVRGDETAEVCEGFLDDVRYYVDEWQPENGGFVAYDTTRIPAGGVWIRWGTATNHGYGHVLEGVPELCIAVEERFRNRGLGTKLLLNTIELAKELGARGISLCVGQDNPRAHRLYNRVGFKEVCFDNETGYYTLAINFTPPSDLLA